MREVGEEERKARAALTRIVEPGDEMVGRWLRRTTPVHLVQSLVGEREMPTGVSEEKFEGLRLRATRLDVVNKPAEDLAAISALGGRFVCPGDARFCVRSACCPRSCCAWSELSCG
ncbi:hypothetical protein [Streptomyces rimosus]|uniref:hypothetical protein n=1 Tax=Streptomyces rimosus TaxID=1927 RepID=UPI000AB27DBF|nr:hypothetical protein [Streptomyces rimosus]